MKVTHTVYNIDADYGGIPVFVQSLTNELVKMIDVDIACLKSESPIELSSNINLLMANKSRFGINGYSLELRQLLEKNTTDIIHANGVWTYPPNIGALVASRRDIPYVHSLHGGVTVGAMNQKRCKKLTGWKVYQKRILARANCLCTTSDMETKDARALGLTNRIAQFPLGVDTDIYKPSLENKKRSKKVLLLARIQPVKGLDVFIESWSKLSKRERLDWSVDIAGNCLPGDYKYKQKLLAMIKYYELEEEIKFTGEVFGSKKVEIYQNSDLFVLPSHTENFGLVVAEALACGVPVITTEGTPWQDINTYNAGQWIRKGVCPLVDSLKCMLAIPEYELKKMGGNGRNLIKAKYSTKKVAENMFNLYSWVLGEGDKPNFIVD